MLKAYKSVIDMVKAPDKFAVLKLGNKLCFPLYACAKEVIRIYRQPLEAIGLTYTQYIVMMVLWEFGDMTEKELGEKIYLDSGTLTPLLKKLEKSGLLQRKREVSNERFLMIYLTDKGRKLKEKAVKIPEVLDGCIHLTYDEMITLRGLLNKALEATKERKKND